MKKVNQHRRNLIFIILSLILLISTIGAQTVGSESNLGEQRLCTEKIVYLTFDDGPTGEVTEQILDVLKKEQVPATFFVVGKEIIQREKVLQRIFEEGHGLGLHTYSHNLKKIYANPTVFIQEMKQTEDKINEVLEQQLDIRVIRFPGGSSGRLNECFLKQLHENNYRIFDWHVSIEDGVNPNLPASKLYQNAIKHKKDAHQVILLAHCNSNNKTTCMALPDIIKYYKEQGYTFKAIDNNTQEYYYKIKKTN